MLLLASKKQIKDILKKKGNDLGIQVFPIKINFKKYMSKPTEDDWLYFFEIYENTSGRYSVKTSGNALKTLGFKSVKQITEKHYIEVKRYCINKRCTRYTHVYYNPSKIIITTFKITIPQAKDIIRIIKS